MPTSVLPAHRIPRFLIDFVEHPLIKDSEALAEPADAMQSERKALAEVHALLRTRTRHDFRGYRKPDLIAADSAPYGCRRRRSSTSTRKSCATRQMRHQPLPTT